MSAMGAPTDQSEGQSRPDRHDLLIAGAFALLSLALFLWRIGDPARLDFDETHYVPAARALMALDLLPNPEHPPLGKAEAGLCDVLVQKSELAGVEAVKAPDCRDLGVIHNR